MDQRLERLAGIFDLFLGKRHEAPIVGPGVVEDFADDRGFAVEVLQFHLAHADLGVLLSGRDDALDQRRELLGHIQIVSIKRLDAAVTGAFDPALIRRVMMRHHHHGRVIVPPYLNPRLFPHRKVHRRQHSRHTLFAQPLLRRGDKRASGLFVLRLDRAPVAGARPHALLHRLFQRQFIDMRGNAPDDPAIAPGQKKLAAGMSEKRILARRELGNLFRAQIRHPVLICRITAISKVHEGGAIGLAGDRRDN